MKKEKKDKDFVHKPIFRGGVKAMRQQIRQHLRYPEAARQANVTGTVQLRYGINHLGEVTEVKVISGPGHGCDEEAVRLVRMLRFEVPKHRKLKVLFHKTIQIHFRPASIKQEATAAKSAPPPPTVAVNYHYVPRNGDAPDTQDKDRDEGYTYTISW